MATRAAFGMVAAGFMLAMVVFLHIAAWCWLRLHWEPHLAALLVAGGDLILGLLLVALAARSSPSRVELEALAVRQKAWESAARSVAFSTMTVQLLRLGLGLFRRR